MKQESLARKLQLLRAERGLTLVQASALTGVTRGTLSELESGKRVAYMPTLSKIAEGYGVDVRELLLEEPVPLDKAPQVGQPETLAGDIGAEEESFIPQTADALKTDVDRIKRLRRLHERDLEKIRQGELDYDAVLRMEAVDAGVRAGLEQRGVLGFAEAVRASRYPAQRAAIPLCHELLRELRVLEELTDEARASSGVVASDIHEEVEKDTARYSSIASTAEREPEKRRGR